MLEDLVRDVGCRADLLWRCDLHREESSSDFLAALRRAGFDDAASSGLTGLEVLEEQRTGHRLVMVTRTGRIQLRLAAETRHERRVAEARRLYAVMRRHGSMRATSAGNEAS